MLSRVIFHPRTIMCFNGFAQSLVAMCCAWRVLVLVPALWSEVSMRAISFDQRLYWSQFKWKSVYEQKRPDIFTNIRFDFSMRCCCCFYVVHGARFSFIMMPVYSILIFHAITLKRSRIKMPNKPSAYIYQCALQTWIQPSSTSRWTLKNIQQNRTKLTQHFHFEVNMKSLRSTAAAAANVFLLTRMWKIHKSTPTSFRSLNSD